MESEILTIARDLGVSAEARKKWRQRGCVPHRWRLPIMREAKNRGIDLPENVFDGVKSNREHGTCRRTEWTT
jgi:hypothetical protein